MGWFRRKRRPKNVTDQWYVVVDETAPDLDDPALLIHVIDLRKEIFPSVARRRVRWESIPTTLDYFTRSGNDPGLRKISKAAAADVARLWGAPWPPPPTD